MSCLISLVLLALYFFNGHDPHVLMTAGLFAIAAEIAYAFDRNRQ